MNLAERRKGKKKEEDALWATYCLMLRCCSSVSAVGSYDSLKSNNYDSFSVNFGLWVSMFRIHLKSAGIEHYPCGCLRTIAWHS